MNILRFLIVFTIFSSIYFGMNYYAVYRINSFFHLHLNLLLTSTILFLPYPLIEIVDRLFHSTPTRIAYYLASALAGVVFLTFSLMFFWEVINIFYPIFSKKEIGILSIVIIIISSGWGLFNAFQIYVKSIEINNFGKKIKIVQLSDIHIGTVWNSNRLNRIVKEVNNLNPDLILITGDLVDGSGKITSDIFLPLNNLKAPTFFSLGNHEHYAEKKKIEELLTKIKIKTLENEIIEFQGVNIVGLNYSEDEKFFSSIFQTLKYDKTKPTILMNHAPVGYEAAKNNGVDLQLSGHTHNGQIFPFSLLVWLRFPKKIGLHKIENFYLYISPGTGTWGPPIRLGSQNEITVFNLN